MASNLKPCPFCGGEPNRRAIEAVGQSILVVTVFCKSCGATVKSAYSPGKVNKPKDATATALRLAAKAWNRRADDGR